jgi:hypothetical protein
VSSVAGRLQPFFIHHGFSNMQHFTSERDDRASLKALLGALDASEVALQRNLVRGEGRVGGWAIYGKLGHVYSDGDGYLLCVVEDDEREQSARRWSNVKARLVSELCRLTQDGDDEGCLHLDRLPAPHEVAVIREALGIRKRRIVTDDARRQLEAARKAAKPASNGQPFAEPTD